ncbi:hypothetical protein BX600DRAFT_501344 [Xylariales sp. PMI_506]|nr:hypothetical protein BX600DRAFT_501344 [Xylariales sp. PMI_506]
MESQTTRLTYQCSRQYPCDHCVRRRLPELCEYSQPQNVQAQPSRPTQQEAWSQDEVENAAHHWDHNLEKEPQTSDASPSLIPTPRSGSAPALKKESEQSLAEVFGYVKEGMSSTLALVCKLGVESGSEEDMLIPPNAASELQRLVDGMPTRPILDFLVRYFVAEVNWIDQLLHIPSFLGHYQKWSSTEKLVHVSDVEFSALLLRISCIHGVPLCDIRRQCYEVAKSTHSLCAMLNPRGSLWRVQHIALGGLGALCEGRTLAFFETIDCAIRVAQGLGMHLDGGASSVQSVIGLFVSDKGASPTSYFLSPGTRIFDLILNRAHSRRLEHIPLFPDGMRTNLAPHIHQAGDSGTQIGAPDMFTALMLQSDLMDFWQVCSQENPAEYDIIRAEELYEVFCKKFVQKIPSAFALQKPNTQWDSAQPKLPLQRQLFYIAVMEALCAHFRLILLQEPSVVQELPLYKRILIQSQKQIIAISAIRLLEHVSTLHKMMGGSHTRFPAIIIPTFEAAVPLLCLSADGDFSRSTEVCTTATNKELFGTVSSNITVEMCFRAACSALDRLQTLAVISKLADVGAHTLSRLIKHVQSLSGQHQPPSADIIENLNSAFQLGSKPWGMSRLEEHTAMFQLDDHLPEMDFNAVDSHWEEMSGLVSDPSQGGMVTM